MKVFRRVEPSTLDRPHVRKKKKRKWVVGIAKVSCVKLLFFPLDSESERLDD